MSFQRDAGQPERQGVNRRSFLQTSGGVATGVAVTVVPSAALALGVTPAAAAEPKLGRRVDPEGHVPADTVMAYVHDADKGHVTIVAGTQEMTYHDPALAKRLLDAAGARAA
jgi:hypothetical protein